MFPFPPDGIVTIVSQLDCPITVKHIVSYFIDENRQILFEVFTLWRQNANPDVKQQTLHHSKTKLIKLNQNFQHLNISD